MALKYYTGDKITGLSTDTKPTTIGDGATFYETDTKKIYLKVSGSWVEVNYQTALGFTPENSANKLTAFQGTPDNTHYPSEKLVKDSLDGKMTNPMTASGDIIYGGNNGTPTRLAKGTDGQILTLVSGVPAWAAGGGTMIYPGAGIAVSTGTGWGTSLTAPSGAIVGTTDVQELTNKTLTSALIKTGLTPDTNDGAALGSASKMFSDLFLASGAVINFNNGDTTLTHSANTLTLAGGKLTLGRDFDLTNTTHANQYGIITKNGYPFIHDFNYGNNGTVTTEGNNIFIGLYAGNFTMGSTAEYSSQASRNSAIGYGSLNKNTTGTGNSAIGYNSLAANTTGAGNSAVGTGSLCANTTGSNNTAIGSDSLHGTTGSYNSALGDSAAYYIANGSTPRLTGDYGLYLGAGTKASADDTSNEIVIGYNAIGAGSNKAVIGNSSVTDVYLGSTSGAAKLTCNSIELGHASDTTLSRSAAGVLAVEGVVIPTVSSTNTITNKRNQKRVSSAASASSLTPEIDTYDIFELTALAKNLTINNHSTSTPVNGEMMEFIIKDNGTSRTITWGNEYANGCATLPTATTAGKRSWILVQWNSTNSQWYCISVGTQS